MAIIHMGTLADKGKPDFHVVLETRPRHSVWNDDNSPELYGPFIAYTTYTSHHGLCIKSYERNGYDDSDFFMIVWNEEAGKPETIEFASTRGWSYPCYGSDADATPEIMAKYKAWEIQRAAEIKACERREAAGILAEFRSKAKQIAKAHGVSYCKLIALRKVYGMEKTLSIFALFNSGVRSNFKLSLRAQCANWANAAAPKYDKPFSPKQLSYI